MKGFKLQAITERGEKAIKLFQTRLDKRKGVDPQVISDHPFIVFFKYTNKKMQEIVTEKDVNTVMKLAMKAAGAREDDYILEVEN